jgi:hypothetical protein
LSGPSEQPSVSRIDPQVRRINRLVWISLIVGTLLRAASVLFSSAEYSLPFGDFYGWPGDHGNYVQWARQATAPDGGLLTLYTTPPDPEIKVLISLGERWVHHGQREIANYPPLGLYLIYLEGLAHRFLDPELVANTAVARAVFDAIAFICDIILALGVWRLGTMIFRARAGGLACIVVYLLPPLWLDSCWWSQTDSWILAPAVWMVWAMLRRRWLYAGLIWGVGLSLKPQGILLAPLWAFAWLVSLTRAGRRAEHGAHAHEAWRIVGAVVLAVVVLNATALPFWLTTGDAWLQESYLRNLRDEAPHTTLKAFNIWYIDLLLTYDTDVHATILGVEKDTWGKVLALGGLVLAGVLTWRSPLRPGHRLVLLAGLWLLTVVMLPTRVHERYLVLCLPFLVLMAAGARSLWPGVVGLIVIATFQLLVYHWLPLGADSWSRKYKEETVQYYREAVARTPPEFRDRIPATEADALALRKANFIREHRQQFAAYEWILTIAALASAAAVFVAAGRWRQVDASAGGGAESPGGRESSDNADDPGTLDREPLGESPGVRE